MAASITWRTFGLLPGGEQVKAWTLTGNGGLVLEVIAWGGVVTRLLVPDRNACLDDVVLGYGDLESYRNSNACFGAMVGRIAGRVTDARFCVAGTAYKLTANDPPNHLHGGTGGFHRQLWIEDSVLASEHNAALRLRHTSPAGTEGYPGTVHVAVTYAVADNRVRIETEAVCDQLTPLSLTHHSYFNLAGESSGSIADHHLRIMSGSVAAVNDRMTLLGRLEPLTAANDLRVARKLSDVIPGLFQQHGDLYRLQQPESVSNNNRKPLHAARLTDPRSGRVLDIFTTEDYLQLYTSSALDEPMTGKSRRRYGRHAGVCLECEGYPDGANAPDLGDIMLQPGVPRHSATEYAFSICNEASSDAVHHSGETI